MRRSSEIAWGDGHKVRDVGFDEEMSGVKAG
jgi:hypothetical protein